MNIGLPTVEQFRPLTNVYWGFDAYQVQTTGRTTTLTVPANAWRKGLRESAVISLIWSGIFATVPFAIPETVVPFLAFLLVTVPAFCLWPWYLSLLQLLIVRPYLPLLRIDHQAGVVHLPGNSSCQIAELTAVCDVTHWDDESHSCELQLVLQREDGLEFVLITGAVGAGPEIFGTIADDLHRSTGAPHLSVDLDSKTVEVVEARRTVHR